MNTTHAPNTTHVPSTPPRRSVRRYAPAVLVGTVIAGGLIAAVSAIAAADTAPSSSASGAFTELTTKTGVLTLEEHNIHGDLLAGAVIQIERVADTASTPSGDPSTTPDPATTTTPDASAVDGAATGAAAGGEVGDPERTPTSPDEGSASAGASTTAEPTDASKALSLPVGIKFDIVTQDHPIVLAVPEGRYKLVHLGVSAPASSGVGTTPEATPADQTVTVAEKQRTRATMAPPASTATTSPAN